MRTWQPLWALLALGTSAAVCFSAPPAKQRPAGDRDLARWVDERVQQWQPSADEKKFDEIGWAHSLLDAERLAQEHKRPIFWFTHDGKMQIGRC
jgi:hypothetical protein